jgi:hypothetical protein
MIDYVVLVLSPVDTAVIPAETEQEAINKYELPEEFHNVDIMLYVVTAEEFFNGLFNGLSELPPAKDK